MRSHHRNGVSGVPFEVSTSVSGLSISWVRSSGNAPEDPDVSVPWTLIQQLHDNPCAPDGLRGATRVDGHVVAVYDAPEDSRDRRSARRTFVAVHDPGNDWYATAVFDYGKLPDVRFGINSWRGDHHHADLVAWEKEVA